VTVTELRKRLEHLERVGHGDFPAVVECGSLNSGGRIAALVQVVDYASLTPATTCDTMPRTIFLPTDRTPAGSNVVMCALLRGL
jgi:hypothetical protein